MRAGIAWRVGGFQAMENAGRAVRMRHRKRSGKRVEQTNLAQGRRHADAVDLAGVVQRGGIPVGGVTVVVAAIVLTYLGMTQRKTVLGQHLIELRQALDRKSTRLNSSH